jgi:hypothetical protein
MGHARDPKERKKRLAENQIKVTEKIQLDEKCLIVRRHAENINAIEQ